MLTEKELSKEGIEVLRLFVGEGGIEELERI